MWPPMPHSSSVIEAMFGAQGNMGGNMGSVDADRPFGMLEQKIAALLAGHLAGSLDQVFAGTGVRLYRR